MELIGLLLIYLLFSCKKEDAATRSELVNYFDVILVIGQSNTHQGLGYNRKLDAPASEIKQFGRFNDNNYKIIPATEPLEHFSSLSDCIGFALTFAKEYRNEYLQKGRKVVIIPGGMGSTGFSSNYWNPGDTLYNDAVERTNYILEHFNSKLVAILWHQGESDIGNPAYREKLDSMIVQLRRDITGDNASVPFILGGMVPYWVDQDSNRVLLAKIIENTVNRVANTGFADPRLPFVIVKPDNDYVAVHFDANGQREMGRRYFAIYRKLMPVK